MRKNILILAVSLFTSSFCFGQITVNKEDIKDKVEIFEVWSFKKPFSSKECYFIDYGQKNFKPVNYDLMGQGVIDKDGRKFEKGEWLSLLQYLESQGFIKDGERSETIGDINGRVTTFKKKV